MHWFGGQQGMRIYWATLFESSGAEYKIRTSRTSEPLYLRLGTSDVRLFGQVMAREEYALPLRRAPQVIIDAGANIGLTALYYINLYPTARVLAIEPEPSSFEMLCKNVASYPQIVPIRAALWDTPTTLEVVGIPGFYGAVRVQRSGQKDGLPVLGQVRTVTMSQLMAEYQLDFVDLLKMDIEGAEKEVFATALPWISRVGVIIVELHDRFRPGCSHNFSIATRSFEVKWHRGEHVIVARRGLVAEDVP